MQKTTNFGLKERQDAPLVLTSLEESFNSMSLQNHSEIHYENSKSDFHVRSGNNSRKGDSMSIKHNVFVLGIDGKPLTPTTNAKARKLMEGKQAKPIWNKFGKFGIQMLVDTRKETPKTILGVDFGTKFEGYSVVTDKENNLNVMWKLPDKKVLVRKLKERRILRRARRQRNCRRRTCRFNNRKKEGFIAPSQLMMVNSRLKAIKELFKCYPIKKVVIEDVKFNHKKKRWGKNFSTMEVGKNFIYGWIKSNIGKRGLKLIKGYDTFKLLEKYGLKKNRSDKSKEDFYTHCIDSFVIASEQFKKEQKGFMQRIGNKIDEELIVVDDTYRPKRRRLHDTQYSKGGIRDKYSTGNYKSIRKGTICNFGQVCGGIKDNIIRTYDWNNKRLSKGYSKIEWLSHHFKTMEVEAIPPPQLKLWVPLPNFLWKENDRM